MDREELKTIIRELLAEHGCPVRKCALPQVTLSEADRLAPDRRVYTHDVLTLAESPRLGAGIMEMTESELPWELRYDEVDYVIEGSLTIRCGEAAVTAGPGEMLFIPRDTQVCFCAPKHARFLYVTYPADWQKQ